MSLFAIDPGSSSYHLRLLARESSIYCAIAQTIMIVHTRKSPNLA